MRNPGQPLGPSGIRRSERLLFFLDVAAKRTGQLGAAGYALRSLLNNQTAVLRVTDNLVYFTIKADTAINQSTATTTFTTTQNESSSIHTI